MLNRDIADELGNRIARRVFLNCVLNALLLTPIVFYLSLDRQMTVYAIIAHFALLVLAFSFPMALLNGVMATFCLRRIPDHISITMNPEALRKPLFLANYLGLPVLYLLMMGIVALFYPSAFMWCFLMAIGAWLFSGFISVSAIDHELRWLSIYGTPRKRKIAEADPSRLLDTVDLPSNSQETDKQTRSSRL